MSKIIIIIPNPSLKNIFVRNFEKTGFEVVDFFCEEFRKYPYPIQDKIINIWRRIFFKDYGYYNLLEKKFTNKELEKRMQLIEGEFDFAFLMRADRFSLIFIKELRKKAKKIISYQSDGMAVCGDLLPNVALFDKIYVFDPSDLQQYKSLNFLPLTNCWFDDDTDESRVETDIFYVGVGVPERLRLADKIKEYCTNSHIRLRAVLTIPAHYPEKEEEGVFLSHLGLSYEENILEVKKSKAVLDFKLPYHNGLSFRFFEAMKYKKKLITNNSSVQYYDFYHPDNIFITDFENLDGLKEFLEKPYHEIDENIVQKYGFKNWTHYVLDLPPYQKIDLPKT